MYTKKHVDLYSSMGLVAPDDEIVVTKDVATIIRRHELLNRGE